jgi:hypothetical protein
MLCWEAHYSIIELDAMVGETMSEMGEMDVPMMVEEGPKEAAAAGVDG